MLVFAFPLFGDSACGYSYVLAFVLVYLLFLAHIRFSVSACVADSCVKAEGAALHTPRPALHVIHGLHPAAQTTTTMNASNRPLPPPFVHVWLGRRHAFGILHVCITRSLVRNNYPYSSWRYRLGLSVWSPV